VLPVDGPGSDFLELRIGGRREVLTLADSEVLVGRASDNGVVLADPGVSRVHAVLLKLKSKWLLRDLGSRNGCQVNGTRLVGDRALHDGDEIRIGESVLVFRSRRASIGLEKTAPVGSAPDLTRREREVLVAFAQAADSHGLFRTPPSVREVAQRLNVTEAAVKQHLSRLYDKFALPQGPNRRAQLLEMAVRSGAITLGDIDRDG
jgi:pSer/pThr/pTyr-binding forkhead associated (FHA) protein